MDNQFLPIESNKDTHTSVAISKRQIERSAVSRAIYMITDVLDTQEPIRLGLRDMAVRLLTHDGDIYIRRLLDLLKLSSESGFISEKNTNILIHAINHMKRLDIQSSIQNISIDHVLAGQQVESVQQGASGMSTEKVSTQDSGYTESQYNIHTPTSSPQMSQQLEVFSKTVSEVSKIGVSHTLQEVHGSDIKKQVSNTSNIQQTISKQPVTNQVSTVSSLDIGTRRKKILEIVKSKGQATIHEFIESIQGCSSKTIQRELTSLVLSGTLKKTGERRWSRYSLR